MINGNCLYQNGRKNNRPYFVSTFEYMLPHQIKNTEKGERNAYLQIAGVPPNVEARESLSRIRENDFLTLRFTVNVIKNYVLLPKNELRVKDIKTNILRETLEGSNCHSGHQRSIETIDPSGHFGLRSDLDKKVDHCLKNGSSSNITKSKRLSKFHPYILSHPETNNTNARTLLKGRCGKKSNTKDFKGEMMLADVFNLVKDKPNSLTIHIAIRELKNWKNLLSNIELVVKQVRKHSKYTNILFTYITRRMGNKEMLLVESCLKTKKNVAANVARLKNYCREKHIDLITDDNINNAKNKTFQGPPLKTKGNSILLLQILRPRPG